MNRPSLFDRLARSVGIGVAASAILTWQGAPTWVVIVVCFGIGIAA